jgi:hypothetical protein
LSGLQTGVVNIVKQFNEVQTGVVNVSAGKSSGVQIGVLNYSEDINGAPIGLVSIVKNGFTHSFSWYDESGFVTVGIKHGTKNVYNIYGAGLDTEYKHMKATLGFGGHIDFQNFFLNIDGTSSSIQRTSFDSGSFTVLLSSVRLAAGF